jgi:cytochrome c-type biogenesis protein CcmE
VKRKTRRLWYVLISMAALGGATALVLAAFQENLVFFYGPGELSARELKPDQRLRLGGLVEPGSVVRDGMTTRFRITDNVQAIAVEHTGLMPDLFREGQGVIAEGTLRADGVFLAASVLAKHDEKYMPPEVADALKKAGQWRPAPGPSEGQAGIDQNRAVKP